MRVRFPAAFFFFCGILGLVPILSGEESEKKLDDLLPRISAKEPAEAIKSFATRDGFVLQLAAHEPVVVDPVDAAFDEDGRLFVCEMRGYPFPEDEAKPIGRIRVLSDRDDNGIYEKSDILADDLFWPTGIAVWQGGCFVVAAPDLWYLKDTNDDGVADIREKVFTGFERANVQALANNLKWGLDGWIYGASSSNGGSIRRVDDPKAPVVSIRGSDFRFEPKSRRFEAISGTAQFGNSFDDHYNRFVCSNSNHAVHVAFDSRYLPNNRFVSVPSVLESIAKDGAAAPVFRTSQAEPWRLVRTARRAASGQPFAETELHATGFFTSASGITIYRGDAYPLHYRGNLFVGDVGGNLVHRKKLTPDGPTFVASRLEDGVEFLTSTDNWFRPVNFVNAPDGTLYILDMYRETIEHPWSIPEDIKAHLDLTSGKDRGRIYRLTPPEFKRRATPKLSSASTQELVQLLGHTNAWHRESAARLLMERNDETTKAHIRSLLAAKKDGPRLDQLHALGILHGLGLLEQQDILLGLASADPSVREQSVRYAEGMMSDDRMAHAVERLAEDKDFRVRWQVALSLGFSDSPRRADDLLKLATHDPKSAWMRTAVLLSSSNVEPSMLKSLLKEKDDSLAPLGEELLRIVAVKGNASDITSAASSLSDSPWSKSRRIALAAAFADGLRQSQSTGKLWQTINTTSVGESLRSLLKEAKTIATNHEASATDRTEALRALQLSQDDLADELAKLLNSHEPREVQLESLHILDRSSRADVGERVVKAWSSATPGLRAEMIEVLLARPDRHAALWGAVEKGDILPGQLSSAARQRLLNSVATRGNEKAKTLLTAGTANRQGIIQAYRKGLDVKGDDVAGRKVFERECATCHRLREKGYDVGPNLATVTNRTPVQLVDHILDPNLEILPTFLEYTVVLNDGRTANGLISSETATSITLKRAEGVVQTIPRDEIDEIKSTGKSLMPEGLEQKISKEEMANLIAYLLKASDTSQITGTRK
ncbi:HEAT repeat domain-containing protein [bacterium]|nr:HEAT repeat domain-containing protein [bacterium]